MNRTGFASLKAPHMVLSAVVALVVVIGSPFSPRLQPDQNCAAADPNSGRNTVRPNSGGTMWGSFGALSGKDSPVSPVTPTVPVVPVQKPITPAQKALPQHPRTATSKSTAQDRLSMWQMGIWIGSAAVGNMHPKVSRADVDILFNSAIDIAKKYEVPIPPLPPKTGVYKTDMRASLIYILRDLKVPLNNIATRYGAREATIVRIAIDIQLLRAVYEPGDEEGKNLMNGVNQDGRIAFPDSQVLKPLSDAVARGLTAREVNDRVTELDKLVNDYLSKQK